MKKLNLNVANLNATEILSREELKRIVGGGMTNGTCGAYIPSSGGGPGSGFTFSTGSYVLQPGEAWSAGSLSVDQNQNNTIWRGISKDAAIAMTDGMPGAKWSCDSCDGASWY